MSLKNVIRALVVLSVLGLGEVAHAVLLTDDLVAYWTLDEASGTRSDSVGSSDLTDINTVTSAPGILNGAAQFTAANNEYFEVADNPSF